MKPKEVKRFILDCSVALSWFFKDESDAYADRVAKSLTGSIAVVPPLFTLEVANALVTGERRKRNSEAQSAKFLARLSLLPIRFDNAEAKEIWRDTIALARTHGLSAYDASYLELAIRESLSLASLDAKLRGAAKNIGIPIYSA